MADMDSRQKRVSIVSLLVPSMIPGVVPTGTVTQAERQAFHWTYSGILAGGAAADPVLVFFTTEAFAVPAFGTEAFDNPDFDTETFTNPTLDTETWNS